MASLASHIPQTQDAPTISTPVFTGLVRAFDVLLFLAAAAIAGAWLGGVFETQLQGPLAQAAIIGAGAGCMVLASGGGYAIERLRSLRSQLWPIVKAATLAGAAAIIGLFFVGAGTQAPRAFPFVFAFAALLLLAGSRVGLDMLMTRWTRAGRFRRRIAVVAVSEFSREFIERLRAEPDDFEIVGVYDDRLRSGRVPGVHANVVVRGSVADLVRDSRAERIDVIAVALPLGAAGRIADVLEQLSSTVADVCLTADLAGLAYHGHQFGAVGANPVIAIGENPMKDWSAAKKMCFDYAAGIIALVILSPLLAVLALAVKLDSRGPILFRQPRLGFNNRMFVCYKFRTMYADMTDVMADKQTTRDDPRITRVGRWMRKLSFDELPQLLNVLNGTMSLVGPRPHAPNTKAADRLFAEVVQKYALRHRVKPGITGWAQVNGWRGETTTVEQVENRVRCDLFYIDNWSVLFDLKIVVMTVLREIRSQNAF
ncbi:undecaprenyl-phosphate glucose phosphotransferase [Methylocella silvestris]|uniref:Undecaprenyl-phosphate glucose phosphotransferase n=1 Tax=Methylocella silvestris TaxID=199596 RepID=A0A2J7TKX8_METSI|nr:undecaprenyl-phosphate glucose phosphotransferase [Methylocella silvestris]PNG27413.1 undecaprenyl-phosphate glucose phosphotransferase [Methylocella silvestris]